MDNIVVAAKSTQQLSQTAWGDLSLKQASLVQLPVSPDQVANVVRQGQDLVVTLRSGDKITLGNFFVVDQQGVGNDLVFVGDDGTLWHAIYDADAFTGFTFEDVASLDELMAGLGEAGNATPTFAIAGLSLLGAGGAAAAAGAGAGGGGSGGDDPDVTAPASATDLLVAADGRSLSGRGEAGATVSVRDAAGNLLGSGTVGSDGGFQIPLDPPQVNGEQLGVSLTDAAGNTSAPTNVTAPDITAPQPPAELAITPAGDVLTGSAEAGSTVQVRGPDGTLLGSAVAGTDGSFSVALQPPQTAGQALQVSATDAAGNTSAPAGLTAPDAGSPPDTTAPDAPTDLVVSAGGRQLSGRGEAGTRVTVHDAQGALIATGVVAADGSFTVVLDPAVVDGSALQVDLTDAAGNVSESASVLAPDLIAPVQPTDLAVADGVALTGTGEPGATVQVRDASGNLIGTGVVGADGGFTVTLDPAQANGEFIDVRQTDAAGNVSAPLAFQVPDITAPDAVQGIVVSADGLTVAGRGEAGATVQVRDAEGTLIGSGVVADNGTFVLTLDAAVIAGETISLTQTDAAGNVSAGFDFTVPLTPAPASPTDLALNADGSELTGLATPGNRVEARGADGTLLGSAIAGEDGSFTISLQPPQANGEIIDAVSIDGIGQNSIPTSITAPDITAPAQPFDLAVSADGTTLTGRSEPGSTIRVVDAQGNEIGTAVANPAGSFAVTLTPPQTEGQNLAVTAQDAAGNVSTSAEVIAPNIEAPVDNTPPDAPTDLIVSPGGSQLSGRGEAGTTVQVRDADGNLVGTGLVAADGSFNIPLDPVVIDGTALSVDLTDAAGNVSQPASVLSPDLTAPVQPTNLAVADGVTLTGTGEPGATVQVRDASGNVIGTGEVRADGGFTVTLNPAQANGEFVDVRQTDVAGNTSAPLAFQVPDITAPDAVENVVVSADGLTVSGRGEAGATVEVRDAEGNLIGTGIVAENGTFVLTLDAAVIAGETISLTQTDAAGNVSAGFDFTVPLTPAPASPTDLALNADGSELTGLATPGNRVEARGADGTLLGSAVAGEDGSFTISLQPPQANGEIIDAVAIDAANQTSIPASITAPDITPPAEPFDLAVSADGITLTGRSEPGSTVRVVDAQGNEIGTAVVNAAGSFSVTLIPSQVEGQNLSVTAQDAAGNVSSSAAVAAPNLEAPIDNTPPDAPTDLIVSPGGSQLSGRGEAGTTVNVRDAQGNIIGTGVVAADGSFNIPLDPAVIDGTALTVDLTDAAGNVSEPASVLSPDLTAPVQPTDLAVADGVTLTGIGEPGAIVQVRDAAGNVIGTGEVGADGGFSLTLNPAQANGEFIDVRQTDAAGNTSAPLAFQVPDITAPDAVQDVVVSAGGLTLSGRGEAGATVEIRDVEGTLIGTGTVAANGTFVLTLDAAVIAGETISLTQTDAAGNISAGFDFTVPLTPAPASPTDLALNADGSELTGIATPGNRVEARGADGTLLGSAIAREDGSFTISLQPPQANGEIIDAVAIDAANQTSIPASITAPDITAPAEPFDLAVSADGTTLTGRSEPGSTVRVVDAQGNEIGTAVVNAAGSFAVTLTPPQTEGQNLAVTAQDAAGNVSTSAAVTAPNLEAPVDDIPPDAPTDLIVSPGGSQLSGRGEAGTTVNVRDADGSLIGTGLVAADGSFNVSLDPSVIDGSALQVDLTDAAGNISEPASVLTPDFTAPLQPTELAVDDGVTLTGIGEPGATVQVRDAAGNVIGTGEVGADGGFSLTLNPAQANGEFIDVRQTDAAGNTSAPLAFQVTDITAPDAVQGIVVSADGLTVAGHGEAGATVEVRDTEGTLIGTGVVADNGTFVLTLDAAVIAGETISLTQTDAAGNVSADFDFTVPLTPAPASPTDLALNADGSELTGLATPGNRVEARGADGTLLGSAVAGENGSFTISLQPPQANGEIIDVVAIGAANQTSIPASITAPDITPPAEPFDLAVSADGTTLTGRSEPGSTVRVIDAQGNEIGTAVVNAAGSFAVTLVPPQTEGQNLAVTAQDAAGNVSTSAAVTAPNLEAPVDDIPPDAPTDLIVSPGGSQLSGRGEAGTTVNVRDADGSLIGTGLVAADGSFNVSLDPSVIDGSALQVDLTDAAGNISEPASVLTPDFTAPLQPTELAVDDGVTLTGIGEPGATVQVRDAAGNVIGTGEVGADGGFSLTLNPAQANGEFIDVRQTDAAGNTSAPLAFQVPDITAPDAVQDVVVSADGLTVSGRGEAGATVEVRDADGNLVGTGIVAANGTFVLTLDAAVIAGETISLTQTDAAGNVSAGFDFTIPLTPAPASPTDLALNADGSELTGLATPGNRVEARGADGTLLGNAIAAEDGSFTITLQPPQANGEIIDAVSIDGIGQNSIPTSITAPDITAPAEPSELAVSADGTTLIGRSEPGSTVRVVDAQGNEIGTAVVNAAGSFAVTLAPPQTEGQNLAITAQDAAGNVSTSAEVTAPNLEAPVDNTPPDAPTDLVVGADGRQLSGRGEAGTTVNVRDADGSLIGTGRVAADGSFSISLDPAVIDGTALTVDLTDAAGNVSESASVLSPDLTAPVQPTDLAVDDGVTLTGIGEPGATVQVRDAAGNVIGTGAVGADGGFSLTLNPAQANGEFIDVRQTDAAGNVSAPLAFQVPDITAPDAVQGVVVSADGLTVAGRGEAGATVQVLDAQGNLIGTGTVADNGTFVLTLDAAVIAGEIISLTQTDAAGNISAGFDFSVPLTPAPASPTDLALNADGSELTGLATPGNRVEVRAADGTLLGNAIAAEDGSFTITLQPPQANGEIIDAVSIDGIGQNSIPTSITAPDIIAPAQPSELAVSADGTTLIGRSEPGSTVRVVDAQGNEIGTAVANAAGSFTVTLAPPQTEGQNLAVTAQDAAGNVSLSAAIAAPNLEAPVDNTPPAAPTDLIVSPGGGQLSGRGEAGTTVNVRDANANLIGTGVIATDGSFTIPLDPTVIDGTALTVDITDASGNVSAPVSVLSPDLTAPLQPTDLAVSEGVTLTGTGEPGATVQVRDASGNVIGTAEVRADGGFTVPLNPARANGEAIDVRLTDAAGNTSPPLQFQTPDITAPDPVQGIVVSADGLTVAGRGEAGATVQVLDAQGNLIGTGTVAANGTFVLTLDTAVIAGETISLTQTDTAGNTSAGFDFTVPLTPAPASPTGLALNADGSELTGLATPGNRVEARGADGTLLGSAVAAEDGAFTITLQPPQANGETIDAVAIDGANQASIPASVTAPDITAPVQPSELTVSADGTTLTGRSETGSTVRVVDAQGNEIGTAVVNEAGSFNVTLVPSQTEGQSLSITAQDAAGNVSNSAAVTAPNLEAPVDNTPPQAPIGLVVSPGGSQLSGRGEAGTTVNVRDAQGNLIGSGQVAADGSFDIPLVPAVIDGTALTVDLTDPAGNTSAPVSIATPDLTAPAQPTGLALAEGLTLTGTGEPGATVEVRDNAGSLIGTGDVRADGGFTLTLDPAQANGEAIDVRLTDAAGNTSPPLQFQAPDITAPDPVQGIVVSADGLTVAGRGEAGATVQMRDAQGNLIGTGDVAVNGTFVLTLAPAVVAGETLNLTQTDAAGNVSTGLDFTVPATPAPASPTGLLLSADGAELTGIATPGNRVEVRDANGGLLGSAVVAQNGAFTLALQPPQANGETLDVVAIDAASQSSLPTSITAPDITAPLAPAELAVSADGTTLTGRSEPGSTVRVVNAQGTPVGTAQVNDAGSFSVTLVPAQTAGQTLQATATDAAGNVSVSAAVTAPTLEQPVDTTPPAAPEDLVLSADGLRLTGSGEADARVQVRDAQGVIIASGTVDPQGNFSLDLDPAVIDGSTLQVTLIDAAGNTSAPTLVTSLDLTAPAQPTDLQLVDGIVLSGSGEVGAQVEVRDAAGTLIGSGSVNDDGRFSLQLDPPQLNGEAIDVSLIDVAGNSSPPLVFEVPDISSPDPVSNIVVSLDGLLIAGRGEAGATVSVRDDNGEVLVTGVVAADGNFLLPLPIAVLPGSTLTLVQTDAAGLASDFVNHTVPLTPTPLSPSDLLLAEDGSSLSGTATPGTTVHVRDATGETLIRVPVGVEGTFTAPLDPALANGEQLHVVTIHDDGTSSLPIFITVPDITAPDAPTGLTVSADGSTVVGRAEAGSTVQVSDAQGAVLGSAVVNVTGSFSVALQPPQVDGQPLQVNATDAAGNTSVAGTVTAPDINAPIDTTPPAAPTDLAISADGRLLSGRGEAGATVRVLDAQGQVLVEAQVGLDGQFTLGLTPPVIDGSALRVTLSDAAGNTASTLIDAPDLIAPLPPTDLALSDGQRLTGAAEANARVEVRGADGELLGQARVGLDGQFTLTLETPQRNGEALLVEVIDAAGNRSTPLDFTAPDTTAPGLVLDVVINVGNSLIAGRGEPGATVQVRGAADVLLGSGLVASTGLFLIVLDSAVTPGQTVALVQVDVAGNASAALAIEVPALVLPPSPGNVLVADDGASVTGTAPVGSQVQVRDSQGTVLSTAEADADGNFQLPLDPPLANGEPLTVVVVDAAGNSGVPAPTTAPDSTPPAAAEGLQLSADGSLLSGTGEPGATVQVTTADGQVLGSGVVRVNGRFTLTLSPPQVEGQVVSVVLTDTAGNASQANTIIAPDTLGPLQPSAIAVDVGGTLLSGSGQVGSTITVRDADGAVLGSARVNAAGRFTVTLSEAQRNGETLSVEASDGAGNLATVNYAVPDTQAPLPVSDLLVSEDGAQVSGLGEAGATVTVRAADGRVLGTAQVEDDGRFSVTLDPAQSNGQPLSVEQQDAAGNRAEPVAIAAPDTEVPEPVSALVLSADGSVLSGLGEPGTTVTVRSASAIIGTGLVDQDGSFRVPLAPAQLNGQTLSVTLTDGGANVSQPVELLAPDLQAPNSAEDLALSADGRQLSGSAEAGTRVEVRDSLGALLGSSVVDAAGRFEVTVPAQTNGEQLIVVVIDGAGLSALPVSVIAADSTAPLPADDLLINATGNQLTGAGEVGSQVEVRNAAGELVGSGEVPAGGLFVIVLTPPQNDGQALQVTLTDAANNVSAAATVTAPLTAPPAAPTAVDVSLDGLTVTGSALGAVSVTVRDANGLDLVSAQVAADGRFTVLLQAPLTNGEALSVIATDEAGRTSVELRFNAQDSTPPEAALNVLVSADGSSISGSAEPGSTVIVRNANGELGQVQVGDDGNFVVALEPPLLTGDSAELVVVDAAGNETLEPVRVDGPAGVIVASPDQLVLSLDGFNLSGTGTAGTQITVSVAGQTLGSATVGSDGNFLVFLASAQLNGQTLQVTARSAAGISSAPASLVARDITAPDAPIQLTIERDGSALSGHGEAGATVNVRDASGTLLGSAVVDGTGAFSVPLAPAPLNGETLLVRLVDGAGNASLATPLSAPDLTPPAAASGLALNAAATVVSGLGEAGATVTIRDANGAVLASGSVNQAGQFQITLPAAQISGASLQIVLTDRAGNLSEPAALATPDRTPPLAVTQLALSADGSQLSGVGEAGALVRVRTADGTLVGSARVGDDGLFSITFSPAQSSGLTLGVTQVDAAGNVSAALTLPTPDLQPPAPLSNVTLNSDGLTLQGLGQAGNTVSVRDGAGEVIGTGLVGVNGTFQLTLDSAQLNAERLSVVQTNTADISSAPVQVIAPDLTPPAAPSELALADTGLQLSGRAEAGSRVEVRDALGIRLGTATTAADGTFRVTLDAAQLNGEVLQVTAADTAGNVSPIARLTADDVTAPEPVSHLALSADGLTLTGHGEPGATVTVTGVENAVLGSVQVDAEGRFSVTLSPAAVPGLPLDVVQVDGSDNASLIVTFDVPGLAAPDTPSQLLLAEDGLSISGIGSAGSTVQVYGPTGLLLGTAEVQASGNFTVTLTSRQANGERLEISAEGVDGSLSLPTSLLAPDLIAPQPVTQLLLSNDGRVLSGIGEAGATVTVNGSGGVLLGTAQVAADGRFNITLGTAQLNGERLSVEQADLAGNVSDSISLLVPDRTAPDAPAGLQFSAGGSLLLGTGEAGARVSVMDANGALLGSATVRANGTFEVALTPLQANGETVHVVLTDGAGNRSPATDLTALDTTPPAILSEVTISPDGATLTGRGEVGAVVTVLDAAGESLGTARVDSTGNFSVSLSPALTNAEVLTLTQADAAGNVSPALTLTTPDLTPPEPLSEVQISVDGRVVTGRGEPGATVTVRDALGQELGRGLVQPDETFRVELSTPQINQQVLDVQQADPPGNLSEPVQVTAPDRTPPLAPDSLSLNAAGTQLSGAGEIGSTVRVTVGGALIGTGTVAADGRFLVQLDTPQRNGEQLSVTLEDASQNVSLPTALLAADVTPPAQVVASLNADGTQVSGSGEAGARITVVNNLGNLLAQGVIDDDGRFVLELRAAQQNGEVLSLVAQDATGNPSVPLLLTARDLTPPEPLLDLSLNPAGTLLTGSGEVGATVTVRSAAGLQLGEVIVPPGGVFSVLISPAQANGQTLTIVATDAAGNSAAAQSVTALDTTAPDAVSNLSVNTAYDQLSGRGEAGATVRVVENGTVLGTAVVAANGTFQVALSPTATPGGALLVTQADLAGNVSEPTPFATPVEPVPAAPSNVLLSVDGLVVTGLATAGSEVRVFNAAGTLLGSAQASPQGTFSVTLQQAQLNGQVLDVTAGSSGGQSQPFVLTAADVTPPAPPAITALSGNGLVLSGTGEAGATVTVRNALGNALGSAVVTAAGTFAVTLASPQLNGQELSVRQADAAGNLSTAISYTVPDVQAPTAPGNLQLLDAGSRLVGSGEAGALISVTGRNGVALGTVRVAANGQFELPLNTAQLDGQVLTVRQTDVAGNVSASSTLTAADTTAPAAPTITLNAAGTVLSGSGEAGTRVTVRNGAGVVGTAVVAANGTFVVSLSTPQVNFETLSVSLTDGAGNVSPVVSVVAPDFTPPVVAASLAVNATGTLLTGSGEVGATVTVRGADGSVLQTGTVIGAGGLFAIVLNPPQDNGQALSVTLTDPRGNVSAIANVVAPDIDANAPVVASDNLATAVVNLAPVVTTQAPISDSYSVLVGLNATKTFAWTVAAGATAESLLTLSTDNLLGLLNSSTFTLQVKNAAGAWVDLATGNNSALLTLAVVAGVGLQANIGTLRAGDYQLVVRSGGLSVAATINTRLDIETTSLTQFTGSGVALAGNVIRDLGTDGTADLLGPDNAAVLQVLKGGSYVSAGTSTTVQGLYGSLVIKADGSYTYTPNGSTVSVGKVDVFGYQLLHPNGKSDTANLYVRLDSPQATEVWNDSNLAAPARLVDAVDDVGRSSVSLTNKLSLSSQDFNRIELPLAAGTRTSVLDHTVASGTTADLQVVLTSTSLLALLGNASVQLQKLNASGQYVTVQTVGGSDLLSLVNGTARGYTFANQSAGTYQVTVKATSLLSVSSLSSTLNITTKSLTEFVVDRSTVATGNLLTGDTLGSNLTTLSVQTAANTYALPGYNGISVVGLYGTLLVQADGSYSYTLKSGLGSAVVGQMDTFTYALTHPNGTVDTAQLKVTVAEGVVPSVQRLAALEDGAEASVLAALADDSDGQGALPAASDDPRESSATAVVATDELLGEEGFAAIDGHTLLWQGGDASIDLGSLVDQVQELEVLDLNAGSAVSLSISLEDVIALTDPAASPLLIKGDGEDSVLLGELWSLTGQEAADGIDYNQYTAQEDPSQQLWIQNGVHVV